MKIDKEKWHEITKRARDFSKKYKPQLIEGAYRLVEAQRETIKKMQEEQLKKMFEEALNELLEEYK